MSALGQKRTLKRLRPMSALPPKANIGYACPDIRFVPKADIQQLALNGFLISLKVTDFGQHESISDATSFEA
jgi:hypothetical protein